MLHIKHVAAIEGDRVCDHPARFCPPHSEHCLAPLTRDASLPPPGRPRPRGVRNPQQTLSSEALLVAKGANPHNALTRLASPEIAAAHLQRSRHPLPTPSNTVAIDHMPTFHATSRAAQRCGRTIQARDPQHGGPAAGDSGATPVDIPIKVQSGHTRGSVHACVGHRRNKGARQ